MGIDGTFFGFLQIVAGGVGAVLAVIVIMGMWMPRRAGNSNSRRNET